MNDTIQNYNHLIGSISHGTMRKEYLIPCFCDVAKNNGIEDQIVNAILDRIDFSEDDDNSYNYYESEESDYDLEELFNCLEAIAPPYFYFGSHPGDGADYGFWLCDNVAENVRDSGGYTVSDLAEIDIDKIKDDGWPDGDCLEVLHVNDHGNATLYSYNCKTNVFNEIWAIV